jgi:hypothetical protein
MGRHCEERSDEAIQLGRGRWIASLALAMTLMRLEGALVRG